MARKKKALEPLVEQKSVSEMVAEYLANGGKIQQCPEKYATGAYRSIIVGTNKK